MAYTIPQEWKSEVWWRNRPLEERRFHMGLPRRIAESLADPPDTSPPSLTMATPGLIIRGVTIRESVIAARILNAYVEAGKSGRWMDADDYIEMLKDSFDSQGGLPAMYGNPYLDKYVKGVFDVVVLDGLGEERNTEFAAHELGTLVRKRYDRMKTTIITTQLTVSDISGRYGPRVKDAIADFTVL